MALAFDDYGRPYIILKEQESKNRLRGLDAQKANISAGKSVARILRTSLGPKGMDKMLQSPDGDVIICMYFHFLSSFHFHLILLLMLCTFYFLPYHVTFLTVERNETLISIFTLFYIKNGINVLNV